MSNWLQSSFDFSPVADGADLDSSLKEYSHMKKLRMTVVLGLVSLAIPSFARADFYEAVNLVSDVPGLALITDPLLSNPWGVAISASSPFWVANAASSTATLYAGTDETNFTKNPLEVQIPGGRPAGQIFNGNGAEFGGTRFIFSGLNGTINGWSSGTTAALEVTVDGAAYTGLAMGTSSAGQDLLFAANVRAGSVDVFDTNYQQVDTGGGFSDPDLDPKFHPFNVQNFGGVLFVTYENTVERDRDGVVNMFDTDGNFLGRFADGGTLNSPWGLALAPADFGEFSNAMLVGGFGDGRISAFDPNTGDFLGLLKDDDGNPWVFERLWTLTFGNGGSGGAANTLYFAAGINNEVNGLFGLVRPGSK